MKNTNKSSNFVNQREEANAIMKKTNCHSKKKCQSALRRGRRITEIRNVQGQEKNLLQMLAPKLSCSECVGLRIFQLSIIAPIQKGSKEQ